MILHHNTHIHDIGTLPGASTNFTPLVNHDADSYYEITLNATDANGITGSSISAADQFSAGGTAYSFASWSDGGTRTRNYTIPATAYSGKLRLYALDWDAQGRRETITVNDGSGARSANLSSDFSQGAWVTAPISVAAGGSVTIDVALTGGLNPVLSGVFLGDAPPRPPPVTSAPQGNWVGAYGASGYSLGAWNGSSDLNSLPAGASLTQTQGQRYVWNGSTTDVRALQSPDKSTRKAATWYDGDTGTVKLNLSFTSGYNGNLSIYALDWDAKGRREAITVNDGSGDRTINLNADSSQGAWATLPVNVPAGGSVTITATLTDGLNAVLSGVFLG